MNLFLSRRTWGAGIWADNDSVCHYAYLRHLLDEFYPATGTFMGFSPKFNVGLPYLLYNTPPGLYVLTAILSKTTGLSALASLKTVIVTAYVSVPLLGYALARTFEEERTDLPKFAALTLSLFSSELFGLEFYFKNGMLNPALALPLVMGTLVAYRRAQLSPWPKSLRWIALGAVLFGATIFTHILSAYMACVALMAFMVGNGLRTVGSSVVKVGIMTSVGALLTAEWLYPSLAFAAKHDAAYTWSRDWHSTLSDFADGSLFSSYPVGFFPSFITQSNVGIAVTYAGFFGLAHVTYKRFNGGVVSCALGAALAMLIACGPTIHFGVSILPLYDKLLWYRFVTLATPMWMMVAAYGAYRLATYRGRYFPFNLLLLGVFGAWALFVMTTRAVKISTAQAYAQFDQSTADTARWLRDHGDKRGRVFSEFLGQGVVQAISVNYARHMIPVLSGFEEASGWIYENNPASQALMKKGPFWFNPMPMIEEAERYDVKYVVAGSPQLIHALEIDPRWTRVLETPDLQLFERAAFTPNLVDAQGAKVEASVAHREFLRGGGYAYDINLDVPERLAASTPLLVKTNYAPTWRATLGGVALAVHATNDGLLLVDLPAGVQGKQRLALRWGIDDLRGRGRKGTLVGIALALLLVALGYRRTAWPIHRIPERAIQVAGVGALALALFAFAWRSRHVDLSDVGGFGIAGGMVATSSPTRLRVGSFDDDVQARPIQVLASAWSPRHLSHGQPARTFVAGDAAIVTLGRSGRLTLRGPSAEPIDLDVHLSSPKTAGGGCTLHGRLGEPMDVPGDCLGPKELDVLGHRMLLRVLAPEHLEVAAIEVTSDIRYVEAESFRNTVYDGGYEAFYTMGSATDYFPMNGVLMTASPPYGKPVNLTADVDLTPGEYDVWVLAPAFHPRFRMTRGDVSMSIDGEDVGTFDGVSRGLAFWDRDGRFEWSRLGQASIRGGETAVHLELTRKLNAATASTDVDALAFEPR